MALRSRLGQLPFGDQGLLISRRHYLGSGGMAPLPLMEDLEFVQRLRQKGRIGCLGLSVKVNGRRWQRLGVWETVLANRRLRHEWRRGVRPELLARRYYGGTVEEKGKEPSNMETLTSGDPPKRSQGAYQKAQRRFMGSSSQPRLE